MTQAERQSIIFGAFAAIRRTFNDQIEAAYDRGKADGLIAMESREDRRDVAVISDPPELRLVH